MSDEEEVVVNEDEDSIPLIKKSYPCCNAASRFEKPQEGQQLPRKCGSCGKSYMVTIVEANVSGRYGVPVLKVIWEPVV